MVTRHFSINQFLPVMQEIETSSILSGNAKDEYKEVSFFTGRAPENWEDQVLFLRSKGGSKDFFKLKREESLIFFKEMKYFVKHSWNSC